MSGQWIAVALLLSACAAAPSEPTVAQERPSPPAPLPSASAAPLSVDGGPVDAGAESGAPLDTECPADMAHVKRDFCPEMERRCLKREYDKANHLSICHEFEEGSNRCRQPRVPVDFCIDRYEFPNQKGAHPPWMVDWYTAMGRCAALGKRLCYEREWTAACEGPDETPFPYGWVRSPEKCNFDNAWVNPSLDAIYSSNPAVSEPELRRLDRSVPSGSKPECVSGYGVYDLTGNFDEWALADFDRPDEKAVFAALKGGAWGHVRNACRPVTTSHDPTFTYYFVSFRCCQDPASLAPFEGE
jgi:formylglycine-generating enzyme